MSIIVKLIVAIILGAITTGLLRLVIHDGSLPFLAGVLVAIIAFFSYDGVVGPRIRH